MGKKLFVTLEQLREIEETYPMPFYICDKRRVGGNAAKPKQTSSWNKGYKEYSAAKAMPDPFLLNILKDMGCGTDCPSMIELMMSRAYDFSDPNIMFSSNDTSPKGFAYVKKLRAIINLDDTTHIQYLEETLGHTPGAVSRRFNPGGLFKVSNDIIDNPEDSKCGMTTKQIGWASKILKEKGARRFGTHAFLASSTATNEYYPTLARTPPELTVRLKEETGVRIAFISLSGGIEISYRPDQEPNDILTIDDGVRRVYEETLVPAGMEDMIPCTELRRFMIGPCGALVTEAAREKHTCREYVGVDACAVDLMRPATYGAYHCITVIRREDEPYTRMHDVIDSPCENNDKFVIDRILPEIRKGDLLFVHDTGAHGFTMGYNYSGKLESAGLLLRENGAVGMTHRAETPEDYFTTFDFCDILGGIE